MSKTKTRKYIIGYDPAYGEDESCFVIVDRPRGYGKTTLFLRDVIFPAKNVDMVRCSSCGTWNPPQDVCRCQSSKFSTIYRTPHIIYGVES